MVGGKTPVCFNKGMEVILKNKWSPQVMEDALVALLSPRFYQDFLGYVYVNYFCSSDRINSFSWSPNILAFGVD